MANPASIPTINITTTYLDAGVEVSNGIYTKYIEAAGSIVAKRVGQKTSYFVTDHLGTISGIADGTGEISIQAFEPFGKSAQVVAREPHGFTGERRDASGLIYLQSRYYNPDLGRFTSSDVHFADNPKTALDSPIEAVNAYVYATNNPVNRKDPTGNDSVGAESNYYAQSIGYSSAETANQYETPGAFNAGFVSGFTQGVTFGLAGEDASASSTIMGALGEAAGSFYGTVASSLGFEAAAGWVVGLRGAKSVGAGASSGTTRALASPWPPNRGFFGVPENKTLSPGALIDRYGFDGGTFVSPKGVPFAQRALHPTSIDSPYSIFEVLKPIDVRAGPAGPWFGQPGMGTQYELQSSVRQLIDGGYIKRLP